MLVRCLYASRVAQTPVAPNLTEEILRQCRKNNPARGITGMLCFCEATTTFVQVLEGGRSAVNELLIRIFRDERHRGIQLLDFDEIGERRFGEWTMGVVRFARINPVMLLKYSALPRLDPFSGPAAATLALLHELAASGTIDTRPA